MIYTLEGNNASSQMKMGIGFLSYASLTTSLLASERWHMIFPQGVQVVIHLGVILSIVKYLGSDSEYGEYLVDRGAEEYCLVDYEVHVKVANEVEYLIRGVRSAKPCDVQEAIRAKYGVDVPYFTAWNAWTICMEMIVGSYDEGTCISCKDSIEGFKNGCRPVLGLDGCFLKEKYGGVCLSMNALDGNNGLFPVAVFFYSCIIYSINTSKVPYKLTSLQPSYTIFSPPLVRGPSRPRKEKIKGAEEALGNSRRYGKCGALGHMKKTCKGLPAEARPVIKKRSRVDTNSSKVDHRRSIGTPPKAPTVRGRGRGRGMGTTSNGGRGANSNIGMERGVQL
ncbi:hypothetical protein GIB67_011201 [Kingdonia uniflora]|uniref:Uncharacterized protein n=1 Tax=Kingdonia uniflora TaxID=39325 RepID=A0A7J7M419_9MAGN|nr:hypothetical protein GIB67_011201 [Kingdonia uniflora]